MAGLCTGDPVYIYKLDRLGRSLKYLLDIVAELKFRGVDLNSLTDAINTTSAQGLFVFRRFASLAKFERKLIWERTHAEWASARVRSRVGGRRRGLSEEEKRTAMLLHTAYAIALETASSPAGPARALGTGHVGLPGTSGHLAHAFASEGGHEFLAGDGQHSTRIQVLFMGSRSETSHCPFQPNHLTLCLQP